MAQPQQVLNSTRINAVFQAIEDPRLKNSPLTYSQRVKDVNAADGEIMASFQGLVQIADLVADDAQAGVYAAGQWSFESNEVPNLKVGAAMTQSMLNKLLALQNVSVPGYQTDLFTADENRTILNIKRGIAWRRETLLVGMFTDSFSYDRLGIKLTNASWGMPSDLKVALTGSDEWNEPTTAKPVSNILTMLRYARIRYGIVFNRITMTTPAFELMIATQEFQDKSRQYLAPNVSFVNLNTADTATMQALAEKVLRLKIEFNDDRYQTQNRAGQWLLVPFQPLNQVVFDFTGNDNDTSVYDFANGIVTESVVASLTNDPTIPGGPQFGPIGYVEKKSLNPPNIEYWGVQRGFPRKHVKQSTAVLDIGEVEETIPVTLPVTQ